MSSAVAHREAKDDINHNHWNRRGDDFDNIVVRTVVKVAHDNRSGVAGTFFIRPLEIYFTIYMHTYCVMCSVSQHIQI